MKTNEEYSRIAEEMLQSVLSWLENADETTDEQEKRYKILSSELGFRHEHRNLMLNLMREDFERKAWECSVEMMGESFKNSEMADHPKCTRKDKYNGLASGWKYAAYKLREAFGFPKSETPDRFKK